MGHSTIRSTIRGEFDRPLELVDKPSGLILGAHLLGPGAEETINLFALAMKHRLTATDIKSTLFAFPTFASDIRRMV